VELLKVRIVKRSLALQNRSGFVQP